MLHALMQICGCRFWGVLFFGHLFQELSSELRDTGSRFSRNPGRRDVAAGTSVADRLSGGKEVDEGNEM